jgi:hypothetical protein
LIKHGPLDDPTCEEIRVGLIAQSDPHTYLSSLAALLAAKTITKDSNGFAIGDNNAISLVFRVVGQQSDAQDISALETIADGPSSPLRLIALSLRKLTTLTILTLPKSPLRSYCKTKAIGRSRSF